MTLEFEIDYHIQLFFNELQIQLFFFSFACTWFWVVLLSPLVGSGPFLLLHLAWGGAASLPSFFEVLLPSSSCGW